MVLEKDTIINSRKYHQLFRSKDTIFNAFEYIGGIREDSLRMIYFNGDMTNMWDTISEKFKNRDIILINSRKSSVTTQKHKSQLHSSTSSSQWVFHVPNKGRRP